MASEETFTKFSLRYERERKKKTIKKDFFKIH